MARFRTKVIFVRGIRSTHLPGTVIDLTEEDAALHLSQGTIERVAEPAPPPSPEPAPAPSAPVMVLESVPPKPAPQPAQKPRG